MKCQQVALAPRCVANCGSVTTTINDTNLQVYYVGEAEQWAGGEISPQELSSMYC